MALDDMPLDILNYLDAHPQPLRCWERPSSTPVIRTGRMSNVATEIWRYYILPYCDLMSLLRLNWVNRRLRLLLNDADFVVEYQSSCWYLQPRYCRCQRNIFYLDLSRFLDFAFDYHGQVDSEQFPVVHTVQDVALLLRRWGRTPDMLVQSFQRAGNPPDREPLQLSPIVPQDNVAFVDGFTRMWLDNCVIPMPRCIDHPVEQRRVHTVLRTVNERLETETVADYERRVFWREFHEVTDDMVYEVELGRDPMAIRREGEYVPPIIHGFEAPESDLLDEWMAHCKENNADPYDPLYDDAECRGFRSLRWSRNKMHDSAVGGSAYPLELCLHRDDLTRTAGRLGVDYLDRMYVHLNRYRGGGPEWNTIDHRGVLYFMGLRYEHAAEDFCTWILNTQAMLNGLYAHMWLDALGQWTRMLMAHLHVLGSQVETDLRFSGFQQRWRFLHSMCFAGPSIMTQTKEYTASRRQRDQAAIHLIFSSHHIEENRYLSSLVDRGDVWTNEGDIAHRSRHFLTSLLEQFDHPVPNHRTETQRIQDAARLIRVAEYMTDFAEYVGPRVDPRTLVTRRRAFQIYLSSYVSLVAFCPGWRRTYHWKPSRTHEQTHGHVPHINLQHNHRFQRYLNYCNRRTIYYHPDPASLLNNQAQDATQGWRG